MSFNFKGIGQAGFAGYELTDQLLYNLKFYLDQNLLINGGFNIYLNGQDSYLSNDESNLMRTRDERYSDGTIYEGTGREWIWESGINPGSGETPPFRVSGIYVDGVFHTKATYPHHVDYQHGRIIFEEPQDEDKIISADYCNRSVYVGFADSKEFRVLMFESVQEFLSRTIPSGTTIREHQIWLPSIFIEVDSGTGRGLQLGGGQIKTRTINFHIFAENSYDRNLLKDWLDYQNRSSFFMADLNSIPFPFDEWGDVTDIATNWEALTIDYQWRKLRVIDGKCKNINSLNSKIFRATVSWNVEIDIGSI